MRRLQRKKKPSEQHGASNESFFKKVQTKIEVGSANDKYEVEADRMADSVVNKQAATPNKFTSTTADVQQKPLAEQITPLVQKSSAEEEPQAKLQRMEEEEAAQAKLQRMEEEEPQAKLQRMEEEEPQAKLQRMEEEEPQAKLQRMEEEEPQAKLQRMEEEEAAQAKVQRKEQAGATVSSKTEAKLNSKSSPGKPMDAKTRAQMESGFGADFGHVNIHTDANAIAMCKELGAHAFTYGNDIYFNEGKYDPENTPNKHLLAHELTHTVQQKGMVQRKVQRFSYGTGTPPDSDYSVVPAAERPRVNKALGIIKKIIDNPKKYKRCHDFFSNNNPGNTSLKDVFDRMNVWFDKDNSVWGSSHPSKDIAYSSETWRWGRWSLAGVFVHEMMHLAGQHNEATDDRAIKKCGLPDIDKK